MIHRVLSIQQPWAIATVLGYKPVENRKWSTDYRGPVLIHASARVDERGADWIFANEPGLLPHPAACLTGGIIGRAELVDVVTRHSSKWFFGPYGFVWQNPEPLPFHPCRGQLGLFRLEYP